ncbi:sigma-70 family RNA polymerase sigma factor [Pedobacter petrophilus]|uniref:Sigma-70 family RNA polymerase sigma factor n=1 Tax=Pedobacter petrophilus TaxID=1908241 RepID=A0A7K0G1R5_9SPHI|nr:sigma-70 family RNA polymerase sigma factor [Pedobacter petrophilus]MRX77591.1 sigma-70 family RNA polymerase sigma factor [Pedobacter petrophilus]
MMIVSAEKDLPLLLTRCHAGDRTAQRELYQRYYSFAMGICIRYATNRLECVKIMNNGFCKLFAERDSIRHIADFPANLQKIMINSILNHYQDEVKLTFKESIVNNKIRNDHAIDKSLINHHLLSALQKLPVIQRIIFNLHTIDGYTHFEICKMMNVTHSFSERFLFLAKNTLSSMMI